VVCHRATNDIFALRDDLMPQISEHHQEQDDIHSSDANLECSSEDLSHFSSHPKSVKESPASIEDSFL
jgi:hypothetical protein